MTSELIAKNSTAALCAQREETEKIGLLLVQNPELPKMKSFTKECVKNIMTWPKKIISYFDVKRFTHIQ